MVEDVFGIVGTTIAGAYYVEETVAEGGFGVVYRAFHAGFRAPVALKCLKIPQGLGPAGQELFLEQFRAEAELLFRLSASIPTVVRPLHVDALNTPGGAFVPFMALEWLEGETLEALVRRRKEEGRPALSLKKLVRLLNPVARALERAHNFSSDEGAISIVHRDLKPENIYLARVAGEDVVKILDFGIGKAKSVASQVAGRASQTSSGMASFTPAYGAPEQWLPKRYGQTGPWTDVWGLALTLVESLTGRPVIDGDNAAMMGATLDTQRRPTPRNEGIEVHDPVEAVFQRALAVDPRDRYADAGLFWNDLVAALNLTDLGGGLRRDERAEGISSASGMVEKFLPDPSTPPPPLPPALPSPPAAHAAQPAVAFSSAGRAAPSPAVVAAAVEPASSAAAASVDISDAEIPDLALPQAAPAEAPKVAPKPKGGLKFDLDLAEGERPIVREEAPIEHSHWDEGPPPKSSVANSAPPSVAGSASRELLPSVGNSGFSTQIHRPVIGRTVRVGAHQPVPIKEKLKGPAIVVGIGICLSVVHGVYAAQTGDVLAIGPVRIGWVAGGLVVFGLISGARRLARASS